VVRAAAVKNCIAPAEPRARTACPLPAEPGSVFCRGHEQAPAAQRGGWLSAEIRRRKLMAAGMDTHDMDISNITPPSPGSRPEGALRSLWVGSRPPFDRDLPSFDVLVLCARELQPETLAFHGHVIRCPIPDDMLTSEQVGAVIRTARLVADCLVKRKRVLVTCSAGINRSALVAALALAYVTRLTADDLIAVMRARRNPNALFNPHFQGLIRQFVRR